MNQRNNDRKGNNLNIARYYVTSLILRERNNQRCSYWWYLSNRRWSSQCKRELTFSITMKNCCYGYKQLVGALVIFLSLHTLLQRRLHGFFNAGCTRSMMNGKSTSRYFISWDPLLFNGWIKGWSFLLWKHHSIHMHAHTHTH